MESETNTRRSRILIGTTALLLMAAGYVLWHWGDRDGGESPPTVRGPSGTPGTGGARASNGLIAFLSEWSGTRQLYVVDPDGGHLARLPFRDVSFPAWSPDGSQLAFLVEAGLSGRSEGWRCWDLHVVGADGEGAHRVAHDVCIDP